MEKKTKSLTINQLITQLQAVKKEVGNVEIVLSSDPEGNSFGTITKDSFGWVDEGQTLLGILPCEEFQV